MTTDKVERAMACIHGQWGRYPMDLIITARRAAIAAIDRHLGEGYAEKHPEIIDDYMRAEPEKGTAAVIAGAQTSRQPTE